MVFGLHHFEENQGLIILRYVLRMKLLALKMTAFDPKGEKFFVCEKWIRWMHWCISTVTFSVMINNSPCGFFHNSKGLRPGDPLSPYLFLIAIKGVFMLIDKAIEGCFLSGFTAKGRGREDVGDTLTIF